MRDLYPANQIRQVLRNDRLARAGERPKFGLDWIKRYMPHYARLRPSQLHIDLANDLAELSNRRGQYRNYIAPRGSAKTTWISKAYPMYGALEGIEPLTLLLAETAPQAKKYLSSIKRMLETSSAVARDYPKSCGRGPIWQATHIRLRNGCEIIAGGSGSRVLGATADERRPTLVVVDDGNERKDAYSPTKRERKLDWITQDLLPIGEPGTNFVCAGTPIHREAIVCHLRTLGWPTRSYRAMPRDPDRMDLWHEYGRILTNLADQKRAETAKEYLLARAGEMSQGAELLWPERLSLEKLMSYRLVHGERAYKTEYTDDPGSPEGAEWPSEYFEWPGFWFEQWPHDLIYKVVALDPSKGYDVKEGDYQAHALVGLGRDGNIYIDADFRHETPEDMCLRSIYISQDLGSWGVPINSVVLQDNGTMGLLATAMTIAEHKASYHLPWECLTETDPKPLRIRVASAWLYQRRIRVRSTPGGRMLVDQWRDFPYGSHDDGPDAVATAIVRLEQLAGWRRET